MVAGGQNVGACGAADAAGAGPGTFRVVGALADRDRVNAHRVDPGVDKYDAHVIVLPGRVSRGQDSGLQDHDSDGQSGGDFHVGDAILDNELGARCHFVPFGLKIVQIYGF